MTDSFVCSLCAEGPRDPVTIPCGDTFCLECIKMYWDQCDHAGIYSCPQCRATFTPRPHLRRNVPNVGPRDTSTPSPALPPLPSLKRDSLCDFCTGRRKPAVKSCLVCLAYYCEVHVKPHYESATFKRHKLVDETGHLDRKVCPQHEKGLELFCRSDQMCVCVLCTVREHRGHNTVSAEEERADKQKVLVVTHSEVHHIIQERMKELQDLRHNVEVLKGNAHRAQAASDKIFSEMLQSVERWHAEMCQLIQANLQAAMTQAQGYVERLEQEIMELQRRDAELRQIIDTEDNIHFLQVHHYRYSTIGTPLQLHHYRYSTTVTPLQVLNYRYTTTGTPLQVLHYRYSTTVTPLQVHYYRYTTTGTPLQLLHYRYTTTGTPLQLLHYRYSTTVTSLQVHHYSYFTRGTPLQVHHYRYSTTVTPLQLHHYSYTITVTPLQLHHYRYSTTGTPLQLHHYRYTTTGTPLQVHHYSYSTTGTLLQVHHYRYSTTVTPLQLLHYRYTTTVTSLEVHHYRYTTTGTPLQLHHYSYTITGTPLQVLHYRYTTTGTPLQLNHYSYTTTGTPLQEHHYRYTTTVTSLQVHHYRYSTTGTLLQGYTTIVTPLQVHHYSYTTTDTPLQLHHYRYTTTGTPLQVLHYWYTTIGTPLQVLHYSYSTTGLHHSTVTPFHNSPGAVLQQSSDSFYCMIAQIIIVLFIIG
ncbi:uncharacterized protein ftr84 isoform X1 [Brachyhypopomus gauderio]|uniref:uncharacterized protein ftr84 isoform X1 n=1 Tax=Brachyhypopomus gauderio TaxID=698409 RepID=UPI004041F20F